LALALLLSTACGAPPGADEAHRKLSSGDLPGAVQSYGAWRRESGRPDPRLVEDVALLTLEQALASPSMDIRLAAVEAVGRLGDDRFTERMATLMADEDEAVATKAAAALLHDHPDAPAVIGRALQAETPAARATAVAALGRQVGRSARTDVLRLVADRSEDVRAATADALGGIADEADLTVLITMTKDPAASVRASALGALARLPRGARSPEALGAARQALADAYLGARLSALQVLDRNWPITKGDLSGSFKDSFTAIRAAVVRVKRGDPTGAEAAISAALSSPDSSLRQAALNAVAEVLAPVPALAAVRSRLRDPDPAARLAVARALIRLGQPGEARPILVAALGLELQLRLAAAEDLARLGDERGTDSLLQAVVDAPGTARVRAAEILLQHR
jgi:HEAT repeat protein